MNIPTLPEEVPKWGNAFTRWLGRTVLRCMGWEVRGAFPALNQFVAIAAPHTSNWDFIIGMAGRFAVGIDIRWLGKHTIFRQPFRGFFQWMGGMPVDRAAAAGVVDQTVELFERHERFILGLSPEGTRKRVEKWKTGFYYIALKAKVPIVPFSLDYGRRTIVIGPTIHPTGEYETDMLPIRSFYADSTAKHPALFAMG